MRLLRSYQAVHSARVLCRFGLVVTAACFESDASARIDSAPQGVVQVATTRTGFQWDSIAAPDFTLYVPRGGYSTAEITVFSAATAEAIKRALHILGERASPGHLRVFYVRSRDEMKVITGRRSGGYADAPALGVVLVAVRGWAPAHRHEIMHVLSLRAWGHPGTIGGGYLEPTYDVWRRGAWLREGLAAAAENLCGQYTYRGIVAQMHAEGGLFPLDTLRGAFLRQDDLAAYLQAGSLVQYLLETYGRQGFRKLWRDAGSDLHGAYGKSATDIEADWHDWLGSTKDARPPSVAVLRRQRCSPP